MKTLSEKFRIGLHGVITGDALGNPAQFTYREKLKENPITTMVGGGVYKKPAGFWTDDSSMTLCLAESIGRLKKLDYKDIMDNFVKWIDKNQFTPGCRAYDIGETTVNTIFNYMNGKPIFECGGRKFDENGNGALMRILPAAFYVYKIYGKDALNSDNPKYLEAFDEIHKMTALTHGHEVSLIACDIYCATLIQMISGKDKANGSEKIEALSIALNQVENYAKTNSEYAKYLNLFNRIFTVKFKDTPENEIKSSGYVLDSLEAAIWCFLTTENYAECTLKAVNLGHDADTIADIAGGMASVYYDEISEEWWEKIAGKDVISNAEEKFVSWLEA